MFKWGIQAFVLFVGLLCGLHSWGASFDPALNYRTIDTAHFSIHYPENIESVAQRVAGYAEEAYQTLTSKLQWEPKGETQILLMDNSDDSSGFASVLPYNWISLKIVPPNPEEPLAEYDNWLKLLITHEFTHIVHLSQYGGVWTPFHYVFGKTIAPNGPTPIWIKEGLATFEETVETPGGRGRSSYTEMLVRTSVLQNHFPTIDLADGSQWTWPQGKAPYLYGVKFLQYLAQTYGEEKLAEFNRRTSRSLLLSAVNRQAKKTFGKSYYQLWDDWKKSLQEKYQKEFSDFRETPLEEIPTLRNKGMVLDLPLFTSDGQYLYFQSADPEASSAIWRYHLETKKEERILKSSKWPVIAYDVSEDGQQLVYSRINSYKRYNSFYDLFSLDLKTKKGSRLTSGLRARDPDFFPGGKEIVFVSQNQGTDSLKIFSLEKKTVVDVLSQEPPFTQFHHPRVSPDGSGIVVTAFYPKKGWNLFWVSKDGKEKRQLTDGAFSIETHPVWSPDGEAIYYSSEETGIHQIYRLDWKEKKREKIVSVLTGVFQPTVSPDGRMLVVKYYNGAGFDLRRFSLPEKGISSQENYQFSVESGDFEKNRSFPVQFDSKPYSPFRKPLLLPRYLSPGYYLIDKDVLLFLETGGHDSLYRHLWNVGGTYRTDANKLGYYAGYFYNRWRPVFGLNFNTYYVDFGGGIFEERRSGMASVTYPWNRQMASLAYIFQHRDVNLVGANQGIFGGASLTYAYGEVLAYPASISLQEGRKIKFNFTAYDRMLGGKEANEKQILYGDWREYITTYKRQVLALRASGGYAWGDRVVPRAFTFGGSLGEGAFAGGASTSYFPLRGLLTPVTSGDRAALFSAEYRLPLFSPNRGIGTWPIFMRNAHMALFGDYGDVWSAESTFKGDGLKDFFDDFFLGVGTEFRGDFVVGHGLPVTGRLGYAIIVLNRDRLGSLTEPFFGKSLKNGTLILQFGTSF